jgi:ribonuclease HI
VPRSDSHSTPDGATVAYTDGACRGNPGPGGWAWAVPGGAWASGYDPATTNQRMEILAAYRAIESIDGPVHIVSDSTYVVNCFRDAWWKGWIARGWKNSKKEPVANRDLWEPLVELVQERDVTFAWVKGHSGDPMNDLVDRLAVNASQRGVGAEGDVPPTPEELELPRDAAPVPGRGAAAAGAAGAGGAEGTAGDGAAGDGTGRPTASNSDGRVPQGTPWAVVGLRADGLAESERGALVRRQLAAVLGAQATLHPDMVVMTGLRPGAEHLGSLAAADAGLPYVVVLPYPDPVSGWPESERAWFDAACDAAASVVTLERKRPADLEGRRAAMARRDGWLRRASAGAIVVTDGRDAEAELALRRFTDVLGDDVWTLEVEPG